VIRRSWGLGYFFWGWSGLLRVNNRRPVGMFLLTVVLLTLGFVMMTTSCRWRWR
jgi:hypothetical protein